MRHLNSLTVANKFAKLQTLITDDITEDDIKRHIVDEFKLDIELSVEEVDVIYDELIAEDAKAKEHAIQVSIIKNKIKLLQAQLAALEIK